MVSLPHVVVVAPAGHIHEVVPPHAFATVRCDSPEEALAQISELRARSTPVVLVVASPFVGPDLPGVLMELARRHPEVPVVVATHSHDAVGRSRAARLPSPPGLRRSPPPSTTRCVRQRSLAASARPWIV